VACVYLPPIGTADKGSRDGTILHFAKILLFLDEKFSQVPILIYSDLNIKAQKVDTEKRSKSDSEVVAMLLRHEIQLVCDE
jgi:hypothetical protein